jgi:SAM-dependent methyltransferase
MLKNNCPLCGSEGRLFHHAEKHRFLSCDNCGGLYRDQNQILNLEQEKTRYLLHQNHLEDQGYRNFVKPILEAVRESHGTDAIGLDFGCGHTPVISEILKSEGYAVDVYDPVFFPQKTFEGKTYDFIICCEVMEHFTNPEKEFELLGRLLKMPGNLFCMTSVYSDQIDFESWYYKNDPTHVFLYRDETLDHIRQKFGFQSHKTEDRLIVFSK